MTVEAPIFTIGALLAVGILILLAFALVATVLIASRHSLVIWQQFKSVLAVLVWVVPAGALIVWIAQRSDRHFADVPHSTMSTVTVVSADAHPSPATVVQTSHSPTTQMAVPVESDAVAPRLKVRRISSDDPNWGEGTTLVEGRELLSLSSQRFATLAEAEEQMTQMVLQRIRSHYQNELSLAGNWTVPIEAIDRFAVKDHVGEVIDRWDFGNGITGKMHRAHLRLDFSPQLHDALNANWRSRSVEHRIGILGGLLGLVTLMLGTAASYFRLDDATGGKYRKRLKVAAAAVVAAGGLAATAFVS